MIYEDEQPDIPIIRREDYEDDYAFQTARQNAGFPCSNCWAKSGHYDRCNMFSSEWDQAAVDTLDRMARLAGESDVEWVPNFSEEDLVRLKGMGVTG